MHVAPFGPDVLRAVPDADSAPDDAFRELITNWMVLTGALNELSRSIGVADSYPFVLSAPAVRKLHLVHCLTRGGQA